MAGEAVDVLRGCSVCGGFGPWRRAGHAEWCDEIAAVLRARPAPAPLPEHGTPRRYLRGCSCLSCARAWLDYCAEREAEGRRLAAV